MQGKRCRIEVDFFCICVMFVLVFFTGKYHHFDNIVLPAPQEKTRLERVKSFFGWSSDSSTNHEDMQKKCLEIYLSAPRKVICDCELSPTRLNIPQATKVVVRLFRQLHCQKIYHNDVTKRWFSYQLSQVQEQYMY